MGMGAFCDIKTVWEYSQLTDQAKNSKPYRNTDELNPKYPLGKRRYSDRYFKPRIDLIDEVRDSPYGVKETITTINKDGTTSTKPMPWTYYKPPIEIYYTDRYMLGTFYSDNTFKFNPSAGCYGQGDNGIISSVLPGWIVARSNYGGLVFVHRQTKISIPVYQGMRIRLCDGSPTEPFELHANTLDRKKTKAYRAVHDEMFKIATAMLSAMGEEAIFNEMKQMVHGQVAPFMNYRHLELSKAYDSNDPAGAVMWLALRYNIKDCRSQYVYDKYMTARTMNSLKPKVLVRNVKDNFYNEVYKEAIGRGESLLKSYVYRYGDKLPTAEWGQKIFVNGVEHKRIV
jgi:hypothetical protein